MTIEAGVNSAPQTPQLADVLADVGRSDLIAEYEQLAGLHDQIAELTQQFNEQRAALVDKVVHDPDLEGPRIFISHNIPKLNGN